MRGKPYQGKIYYGWIIVLAGIICMAVTVGVNNCMSQFIKPVCADLGFTRQEMSTNQTIIALGSMVFSLGAGKFFQKFNLRSVLRIGAVLLSLSVLAFSFANSLPVFYLISLVFGVCNAMITTIPFSIILGNWFPQRYGFAIGWAFMGSGIGGMVLNSLLGQWIPSFGWRFGYRMLALVMFVLLFVCVFFVIRVNPGDMGLSPYQDSPKKSEKNRQKVRVEEMDWEGYTLAQAAKTPSFWAVVLCTGVISVTINVLNQSVAPHLNDVGYSVAFSANVVSAGYAGLAIGKILLGQMFDKLGSRTSSLISGASLLLGMLGLIFARFIPMLAGIVVGVGLGCAFGSVAYPIIARRVFGTRDAASIYGVITAAANCGGMAAPIFLGSVFDSTGSYVPCFVVGIVFCVFSMAVYTYQFTKAGRARKRMQQEASQG